MGGWRWEEAWAALGPQVLERELGAVACEGKDPLAWAFHLAFGWFFWLFNRGFGWASGGYQRAVRLMQSNVYLT